MREKTKNLIATVASRAQAPVVVNSFGRSGSTVLFEGVAASAARGGRVARKIVRGEAWRLDRDPVGRHRCYKSHDYPTPSLRRDARVLYVFGDPVDATHSVAQRVDSLGHEWLEEHCRHLRVEPFSPETLFERDALRIKDHLQSWLEQDHVAAAFVRYEAMWDHLQEVSDFVGFEVILPPKRQRTSGAVKLGPDPLREVYADAIRVVEGLPDWSIHNSSLLPPR